MPFEYVNRMGDKYYLVPTKGRPGRWHFARKPGAGAAEFLPDGYEPWERPDNGQVLLRKIKPTRVTAGERQLIVDAITTRAKLRHFIVEVEDDAIVVHLPNTDERNATEMLAGLGAPAHLRTSFRDEMVRRSRYSPMMRFSLLSTEPRLFSAERWCFLGGIDDWFYLDGRRPLAELVQQFVPHLGKESFFELA